MENLDSAIYLSILGDVIGFGNGQNEFNNGTFFTRDNYKNNYAEEGADYSTEMVFNFIYNGGYSAHPLLDWTMSDDSIMMLANAKAFCEWDKKHISDLIEYIRKQYIALIDNRKKIDDFENKYKCGMTTLNSLKRLLKGEDYEIFPYNANGGGNGGAMRSGIIGIMLKGNDLIKVCVESTCMTHVNGIAILGSITIALLCQYSKEKMHPAKWQIELMEVLESDIIDNYIKENKNYIFNSYKKDKIIFVNKWKNYIEDRFDENSFQYKKSLIMKYPHQRSLYYNKFSSKENEMYPGAGGDDSVIIAFDCFMDCEGSWEKVVTYSMLHVGDSDSTGAMCGMLYGLYYGYNPINTIMKDNLIEDKSNINIIIKNLIK